MDIATRHDLAVAYTPGVAEPCKVIAENPEAAYDYTLKANTVVAVPTAALFWGWQHRPRRHAGHGGQPCSRPLAA
ncbi:MAG: hypothetical protein ACLUE1_01080 [Adlercreutzia equolifaciens]